MTAKRQCEQLCPLFQKAMEVLAKPWTGLIVASLEAGPLRFSELGERIPNMGDRILSARLKELEAEGVIRRRVHPGPPVKVEYALSEAGKGFREVYDALCRWGATLAKESTEGPVSG
jgi:DNA-binding HxlR family transcriptional regulator